MVVCTHSYKLYVILSQKGKANFSDIAKITLFFSRLINEYQSHSVKWWTVKTYPLCSHTTLTRGSRFPARLPSYTHILLLQVLVCSCSLCSCQGCACPYCHSCWLPYNTEECECRCEPILHSRMVPPTHTVFIPSTSHFLHHTLFFLSSHSRAHTAFVLLRSSCCLLPLWFLPCWLFCWQTPAGCHGWDRGGILSV